MSSILEKFIFLFEGDTKKLQKSYKEASKKSDDLNQSINKTGVVADELQNKLSGVVKKVTAFATSIVTVSSLIQGLKQTADYTQQLDNLSAATGINASKLAIMGDAVKSVGGDLNSFYATVKNIDKMFMDFTNKGAQAVTPFFYYLGISATDSTGKIKNFMDILPELSRAFDGLDTRQAFFIGKELGLDEGTIKLLQQGSAAVDKIIQKQTQLNTVTKKDTQTVFKFNMEWQNMLTGFRNLFTQINRFILPIFGRVVSVIGSAVASLAKHADVLKIVFGAVGLTIVGAMLPAAVATAAAIAPFLALASAATAVIAAVAILGEDFLRFWRGQSSVLGDMLERWPRVAKVFKIIGEQIKNMADLFISVKDKALEASQFITNSFKGAFDKIGSAGSKIGEIFEKAKNKLGLGKTDVTLRGLKDAESKLNLIAGNTLTAPGGINRSGNSLTKRDLTVNINDIIVQTQATDANEIARSFNESLKEQIQQAIGNFDDGVRI